MKKLSLLLLVLAACSSKERIGPEPKTSDITPRGVFTEAEQGTISFKAGRPVPPTARDGDEQVSEDIIEMPNGSVQTVRRHAVLQDTKNDTLSVSIEATVQVDGQREAAVRDLVCVKQKDKDGQLEGYKCSNPISADAAVQESVNRTTTLFSQAITCSVSGTDIQNPESKMGSYRLASGEVIANVTFTKTKVSGTVTCGHTGQRDMQVMGSGTGVSYEIVDDGMDIEHPSARGGRVLLQTSEVILDNGTTVQRMRHEILSLKPVSK